MFQKGNFAASSIKPICTECQGSILLEYQEYTQEKSIPSEFQVPGKTSSNPISERKNDAPDSY